MMFYQWFARQFQSFPIFSLKMFSHFNQLSLLNNPARPLSKERSFSQPLFCTKCILDCFSWPFGPSETICPKNLFRTTINLDDFKELESNKNVPLPSHSRQKRGSLFLGTVLVFRQRLNSDQLRKINEKT